MSIDIHHCYVTPIIAANPRLHSDAFRFREAAALIAISGLLLCARVAAESPSGEWRTSVGGLRNTHYLPVDRINGQNFNELQIAWQFKADSLGPRPETNSEAPPLMVNGVEDVTAGTRRAMEAFDAATGELLWMHAERQGKRGIVAPGAESINIPRTGRFGICVGKENAVDCRGAWRSEGNSDAMLRAYDERRSQDVGAVALLAGSNKDSDDLHAL